MLAGALGTLVHLGSTTARLAAVDVNNVYGIAHATVSRRRIESGLVCQVRPVALETMWRKAREREREKKEYFESRESLRKVCNYASCFLFFFDFGSKIRRK